MRKFKAIGFDYGRVIGGGNERGPGFMDNLAGILQMPVEECRAAYFAINNKINTGEISNWREFWVIFLTSVGKSDSLEQVMVLSDKFAEKLFQMDERMVQLVDDLRSQGYKIGLLSNNTIEGGKKLRSLGLHKHFDVFHISAETKIQKPDPKAFALFSEALGVKNTEMIFIDDSEKSLSTAEECGFTPILFSSYEVLKQQLSALGV